MKKYFFLLIAVIFGVMANAQQGAIYPSISPSWISPGQNVALTYTTNNIIFGSVYVDDITDGFNLGMGMGTGGQVIFTPVALGLHTVVVAGQSTSGMLVTSSVTFMVGQQTPTISLILPDTVYACNDFAIHYNSTGLINLKLFRGQVQYNLSGASGQTSFSFANPGTFQFYMSGQDIAGNLFYSDTLSINVLNDIFVMAQNLQPGPIYPTLLGSWYRIASFDIEAPETLVEFEFTIDGQGFQNFQPDSVKFFSLSGTIVQDSSLANSWTNSYTVDSFSLQNGTTTIQVFAFIECSNLDTTTNIANYHPALEVFSQFGCGGDEDGDLVISNQKCSSSTGIQIAYENDFVIYPNPATERLTIVSNYPESYEYKIFDTQGREVRMGQITYGENIVQVESLSSGLYSFQTVHGTKIFMKQ